MENRFCFECGTKIFVPGVDAGLEEPTIEWPDDLPRTVTGADGATLRLVPAGYFWMGSKKRAAGHVTKKDEQPRRMVWVDSFYVDETPVTNGQYATYLSKTGRRKPPGFRNAGEAWTRTPVTRVTWDEATAYAKWAERRLPTEAEWEKAARGVDGRVWPWGDDAPSEDRAVFGDGFVEPVGRPEGKSPFGALDMAGNVWEWCEDFYDQHFYPRAAHRNPRCVNGDPRYRVARGGACTQSAFVIRAAFRGWNLPHLRAPVYGFRCAADVARYRSRR